MARFGRSRPRGVVPLADTLVSAGRRDTQFGVLARSLLAAEELGLVVPETWVVSADVFRHVVHARLPPAHDPSSLLRVIQRPIGIERAARARERLLAAELDTDLERELDTAYEALAETARWGLAVRASALLPDAGISRAAGLSRTELAITSREELGRAVRRAWALATSEATLGYLRHRRVRDVALGVVIQPVIVAEANAILVTDARGIVEPERRDPASAPSRLLVGRRGLGSRAADVALAQVVHVDGAGGVRESRASDEHDELVVRGGALVRVPSERRTAPLEPARIAELVEIARRLDSLGPTEVHCVVPDHGDVAVVDLTPALHLGNPGVGSQQSLWARAGVGDVPAEPLTPLSRHLFTSTTLDRLRRAFAPQRPRPARLSGLVALVDGRSYVNLSPLLGLDERQSGMDPRGRVELVGAQWSSELDHGSVARPSLARAGLRLAQVATEQRLLSDDVNRFERQSEQQRRWLSEMDLAILPDDALTTTLNEVRDFLARANGLFSSTHAAVVNGHALLTSVLSTAEPVHAASIANAVTAGADVITTRPATAFSHVAAIVRLDPDAAAAWAAGGAPASVQALPDGPARRALGPFLVAYGNRGLSEAELASPRFAEDPRALLAMIGAALRGNPADPDVALSRARSLADRRLALLEPELSFFETRLVREAVSRQRELFRLRERCRQHIARGLAMIRVVALDVDRRLRRVDPSLEPGAALCLSFDELSLALAKYRADLSPIVRARRADMETQRTTREPPAVFRGITAPSFPGSRDLPLQGLSASAGSAEGTVVRVGAGLEGLTRFSPGAVLVVKSLDLGFSPLFFLAKAIVTELGTPLSSSMVVARDCAVPVVSGIAGAWVKLRDGDRVQVDGDGGTVRWL